MTSLIDNWMYLQNNDQAVFVEAVEQLLVNSDISSKVIQTLQESALKLQTLTQCTKVHLLLFVQNKFLGLYSRQVEYKIYFLQIQAFFDFYFYAKYQN